MKVLIVEDEPLAAMRLSNMIHKIHSDTQIVAVLSSVSQTRQFLSAPHHVDLIMMDIHLEDDECFRIFEDVNVTTPVIFTTAYDRYMDRAFKLPGIDYLMKPVSPNDLEAAFNKYLKLKFHFNLNALNDETRNLSFTQRGYKDRFLVTNGTRMRFVTVPEISYFQVIDKITFIVTKKNELLPIDYSLEKVAKLLCPNDFFRINRQFMVGLSSIAGIQMYSRGKIRLELLPGAKEKVFVSLDRATAFKEWLGK